VGPPVPRWLLIGALALTVGACASQMSPLQQRAYDAFRDCQRDNPTARLIQLTPEGKLGYTAEPVEYQRMRQCLGERYGYRFAG
jgi:hypothetical protein